MVTSPPPPAEGKALLAGAVEGVRGVEAGVGRPRMAVAANKQPNQKIPEFKGRKSLRQGKRSIVYPIASFSTLVFARYDWLQHWQRDAVQGLASLQAGKTLADNGLERVHIKTEILRRRGLKMI